MTPRDVGHSGLEGVTWLWREPSTPRVQTFGPAGPTLGMRRAGTVTLTVEELKG